MQNTAENSTTDNRLALYGLILVAIAPTISVTTGFVLQAGVIAIFVFIFTKLWMFGLPAFWYLKVENGQKSISLPQMGGWLVSTLLGTGMAIAIVSIYFLMGDLVLSSDDLTHILEQFGLTVPWKLAIAILFWIFINSVLEEYVFRWFITSKVEQLVGGKWPPILISAAIFTVHHTIAMAYFINPLGNLLASIGVFAGGVIFSWIYVQYRSVWVVWVAHAIADVAIFAIAWQIIVGF